MAVLSHEFYPQLPVTLRVRIRKDHNIPLNARTGVGSEGSFSANCCVVGKLLPAGITAKRTPRSAGDRRGMCPGRPSPPSLEIQEQFLDLGHNHVRMESLMPSDGQPRHSPTQLGVGQQGTDKPPLPLESQLGQADPTPLPLWGAAQGLAVAPSQGTEACCATDAHRVGIRKPIPVPNQIRYPFQSETTRGKPATIASATAKPKVS